MILVNPGAQSYRCGENKTWDNQPTSVYCQDKIEECVLPNKSHVSHVEWTCDNVFASLNVSVTINTTCMPRCSKDSMVLVNPVALSYSSSENCSSIGMEMLPISIESKVNGQTNSYMICETQLSKNISDACSTRIDTISYENKGSASVTNIDEEEERHYIPDCLTIDQMNPWVARLEKDITKETRLTLTSTQLPLMSNNDDPKPKLPSFVKVSGIKERYRDGKIYYSVIRDKIRPDPVGGSNMSLSFISLDIDSMDTVEKKVMNDGCPDSPSLQCLPEINSPSSSIRLNRLESSERYHAISDNSCNGAKSSKGQDEITEIKIESIMEKCNRCNQQLKNALDDFTSSKYLNNMCHMLDPNTKYDSQCWIGFVKFYGIIEGYIIDNIKYHKKGNPEDGHMMYILHQYLPPHDFRIGHLVYYFSQEDSRREDVLLEIKKFHKNCTFCDMFINSTKC
ncbi:unnamed protein product [Mytilus edulis]|uniref:Uncharacterized protein n=1 Tax=Mytilus edulis TaxID=6550 RepID=A0A8S3RLM5_MYTED|nr:unnamed protein product [Mytilus edulis]